MKVYPLLFFVLSLNLSTLLAQNTPITAGGYCSFLKDEAAKDDTHGLYNDAMNNQIVCEVEEQIHDYFVAQGEEEQAMLYLTDLDAMRYCNWLENKEHLLNSNDITDTETGVYELVNDQLMFTNLDAHYHLADHNEGETIFSIVEEPIASKASPLMMFRRVFLENNADSNRPSDQDRNNRQEQDETAQQNNSSATPRGSSFPSIAETHSSSSDRNTDNAEISFLHANELARNSAIMSEINRTSSQPQSVNQPLQGRINASEIEMIERPDHSSGEPQQPRQNVVRPSGNMNGVPVASGATSNPDIEQLRETLHNRPPENQRTLNVVRTEGNRNHVNNSGSRGLNPRIVEERGAFMHMLYNETHHSPQDIQEADNIMRRADLTLQDGESAAVVRARYLRLADDANDNVKKIIAHRLTVEAGVNYRNN